MNGAFDLRGYANGLLSLSLRTRLSLFVCLCLQPFVKPVEGSANILRAAYFTCRCLSHIFPEFGEHDEDILLVI